MTVDKLAKEERITFFDLISEVEKDYFGNGKVFTTVNSADGSVKSYKVTVQKIDYDFEPIETHSISNDCVAALEDV